MISPVTIGFIAIIVSSTYGMVIDCRYELRPGFGLSTIGTLQVYICNVIKMSSENPTIVEAIRGNHTEGMNNLDVRGYLSVGCEHFNCPKSLPKNIGIFFPNLVSFYYSNSFLESISADALKSMPNLITLVGTRNSVTSLDSDLFQYTPKMVYIDLSFNNIQHVGKDIFVGMDELMAVRLMNNTCIDTQLWTNSEQNRKAANEQLLLACTPLTVTSASTTSATTTSSATLDPTTPIEEQCLARCSLNDEIDELKVQVNKLSLLNAELDERLSCQHQRIATLEKELGMFY